MLQQVKTGEYRIYYSQIPYHSRDLNWQDVRRNPVNSIAHGCDAEARQRSDDSHLKFGFRVRRLAAHLCNASENEKGDPFHGHPVSSGDYGMTELVDDN